MARVHEFDPRNVLTHWYDRATVMTYPNVGLNAFGYYAMDEVLEPEMVYMVNKVFESFVCNIL